MTTWVRSDEATRLLGVSKPTLYAYVSRGMIERHTAVDGRTSLYSRSDVERLAQRSRTRGGGDPPTIDVRIASAVTELHDEGLLYRRRSVDELARTATFERVAELLLTGELPDTQPRWSIDPADLAAAGALADAVADPILRLAAAATALGDRYASDASNADADVADCARRLLALAPSVLGGPRTGTVASRLARAWTRRPTDQLVAAIDRALVLLADHELATSTLAVRVAASVRTDPFDALATGLHTVRGVLHGSAARHAVTLLEDAAQRGVEIAIADARAPDLRTRLSGFGHSIYRNEDPRVAPLIESVRELAATSDQHDRLAVVEAVRGTAVGALARHPNIDFAVAALHFVAGLPADAPLFAVARIAGWAAHIAEELAERPLRFRGLARSTRAAAGR